MKLSELLQGIPWTRGGTEGDPEIGGLCFDSRKAARGDLFVAVKGLHHDGHDHVLETAHAGVAAVLAERPLAVSLPVAVVPSVDRVISTLASRFYGRPSRGMTVTGVTGTSGKTTVTYMLERILSAAGKSAGVIGTVEYRWAGKRESAPNTTPMAGDIQRLLAAMKADGVTHPVMEVSSHSLSLGRVEDVDFAVAVFLNLTPEHLDYHKNMESYFLAKSRIFDLLARSPSPRGGVVNADDPAASRMRERIRGRSLSFGLRNPADVAARDLAADAGGSTFDLETPAGRGSARLPLVGRFNVSNALAASAAALLLEVPFDVVREALSHMPGVPGRLERVTVPGKEIPFGVFVDYAHKDDALRNVLETLRPLTTGRLLVLFGCGGDRDRSKRPVMGETAMKMADHVIITSDNPRSEDPAKIALDVEVGARRAGGSHYEVVLDRREAIDRAIRWARPGDVVLLAGKGHETVQIFKDHSEKMDDRETARQVLASL